MRVIEEGLYRVLSGYLWAGVTPPWALRERQRLDVSSFQGAPGRYWWHAASLGEVRLAARLMPLVGPAESHLLTVQTPHGMALAKQLLPEVQCLLAPRDFPRRMDLIFERMAPRALFLIETELWPIQLATAARRGVPVFILNARMSDRTLPWYRRIRSLLAPSLAHVTALCRSELDRVRYLGIGIAPERAHLVGDLKLLTATAGGQFTEIDQTLRQWLELGPVVIVSNPTEEELRYILIAYFRARTGDRRGRLLIAPRHPVARGKNPYLSEFVHRSQLCGDASPEILVLDSLGELPLLYAFSTGMVAGGTWTGEGGHSLMEAARWGIWVVYGPRALRQEAQCALLSHAQSGLLVVDIAKELESAMMRVLGPMDEHQRYVRRQAFEHALEKKTRLLEAKIGQILDL